MIRAWIAAVLVLAAPALAQPGASIWNFPEEPVAYCAFEAPALGADEARSRALVAAAVRGLIGNTVALEGGSAIADELLQARVLGDAAWRVCLLEMSGETIEVRSGPARREAVRLVKPGKFAAVVEIRAAQGIHDRCVAALEAGLAKDTRADGGPRDRKEFALAGGQRATASISGTDWRDIEWASTPQAFVVGFGKGTLERWTAMRISRKGAWLEQRTFVDKKRGRGDLVFEAFVDLNALRRGVPDEFDGGRLDRLVHAWGVPNDRTFMVHAVMMGGKSAARPGSKDGAAADGKAEAPAEERLLALDLSWTSRAEKPGTYRTVSISESKWPEGVTKGTEGWAVLVRAGVPSWVEMGLDTYEALGPSEFAALRARWERRVAPMLERIVPRIGEWAMVRPGPELTIQIKAAAPPGPDRLNSDLKAFFVTLAPVVAVSNKGWMLEAQSEPELRGLMWQVTRDEFVTQWRPR